MDRKLMMEKAILCYEKPDSSDIKDSVFGVLSNIIKSATGSEIEPVREALNYVLGLNQSRKNYMGVKVKELQIVTNGLFVVDHEMLPEKLFKGYTKQDIVGYTEICRRIHIVKKDENKGGKGQNDRTKSGKPYRNDAQTVYSDQSLSERAGFIKKSAKERKDESTIMELKVKIGLESDAKAAKYLLANQKRFQNERDLIRTAQKILNK